MLCFYSTTSSQVSLRSTKSSTTLLVVDDGTGHDAADLELAADNLEAVLEDEEPAGRTRNTLKKEGMTFMK